MSKRQRAPYDEHAPQGLELAAEMREFLAECGVEVGVAQSTKTRAALEFFAAELRDGGSAPPS